MSAPNVVGLDLSITATGICDRYGNCVTVGGSAKRGDWRILNIADEALAYVLEAGIEADLVVIENLAVHGPGNGMAAAQVMGAVKHRLLHYRIRYALVAPATLKKYATNKGNAGKPEMAVALYKRFGLELADDNQVDAFWLRAAGLDALGFAPVVLPEVQRSVLGKVEWPAVEP